jgi:hypothetical protein
MLLTTLLMAFVLQAVPVSAVIWEYEDAKVVGSVFDVCLDASPCVRVQPKDVLTTRDPSAPDGHSTYAFPLPALVPGPHTALVKACSADDPAIPCKEAKVEFKLVVVPGPIVGLRVK